MTLIGKLNKYLIQIIDSYNTVNIDELTCSIPKEQVHYSYILKEKYTITDLIVKSIMNG